MLKGKKYNLLDHGFIRLVDYMGDDQRIVDAARVSYADGTRSMRDNQGLINYMMKHGHSSPFEHIELEFHIKVPMAIGEQWLRYRTASPNKKSGRYSVMKDEYYIPNLSDVRFQSTINKQGSTDDRVPPAIQEAVTNGFKKACDNSFNFYDWMRSEGISRELARFVLPANIYTEMYWKINLHNLFRFIEQRADLHAQLEIRVYAEKIIEIVKELFPMAWNAFDEYVFSAKTISKSQIEELKELLSDADFERIFGC